MPHQKYATHTTIREIGNTNFFFCMPATFLWASQSMYLIDQLTPPPGRDVIWHVENDILLYT